MFRLVLIFMAGGAGSVLRYLLQHGTQRFAGPGYPWGTLLVNVSGCFAIGLLGGWFLGARPVHEDYRFAIMAGLLGGYTTFSAFGWETMQLVDNRAYWAAGVNVLASVTVGLLAVWVGKQLATVSG